MLNWVEKGRAAKGRLHGALVCFALLYLMTGAAYAQCEVRDFLKLELTNDHSENPWIAAIELAYPDIEVIPGTGDSITVTLDRTSIAANGPTGRDARAILKSASLGDQFAYVYPLSRDLDSRLKPFEDPGRVRNDAFFALLYGSEPGTVERRLVSVDNFGAGPRAFRVTSVHGVACQLNAALSGLNRDDQRVLNALEQAGGGYNWRQIAGTRRLSAHSWGIAVDINPEIGGYWRWSGAEEGNVGDYSNKVPWEIVEALERHGFIWGGKWHHYDGMHFEYRPELILYTRLLEGRTQ